MSAHVPEAVLGVAGELATRGADGDGVNVGEADVVAVEAVRFVDLLQTRVTRLNKGDVDALQ